MGREGDHSLEPNNPLYYSDVGKWPDFWMMWGASYSPNSDINPEEYDVFRKSFENYRAFVIRNMPPRDKDVREELKQYGLTPEKIPGYNPNRSAAERRARRALSDKAFETAIRVGFAKRAAIDGYSSNERLDFSFLRIDGKGDNAEAWRIRKSGTPEEKGKQLEERVLEVKDLFEKCLKGISDEEVAENLDKMHWCQDMVANAEMALDEADKGLVVISDEVRKILEEMENHAPLMDVYMKRARAILNPLYEFVDIEPLLQLSGEKLEEMREPLELQAVYTEDLLSPLIAAVSSRNTEKRMSLRRLVKEDFDADNDLPTIQLLGRDNKISQTIFDKEGQANTLDGDFDYSYVLVSSPSNTSACYKINKDGSAERANASMMQDDFMRELQEGLAEALEGAKKANRGLFIGSSQYTEALKTLQQAVKMAKNVSNPPSEEQWEDMKDMLETVDKLSEVYKNTKDKDNFNNDRERRRYEAMDFVANKCKKILAYRDLCTDAFAAENGLYNKAFDTTAKNRKFENRELQEQIKRVTTRLSVPAADAGDVAKTLSENVFKTLNDQLLMSNLGNVKFDPEISKDAMAKLVALELISSGRQVVDGQVKAGKFEQEYATKPDAILNSIKEDPAFAAMTENMDVIKLQNLLMSDAAKTFAGNMVNKSAQEKVANNDQLEKQMEKQNNEIAAPMN